MLAWPADKKNLRQLNTSQNIFKKAAKFRLIVDKYKNQFKKIIRRLKQNQLIVDIADYKFWKVNEFKYLVVTVPNCSRRWELLTVRVPTI